MSRLDRGFKLGHWWVRPRRGVLQHLEQNLVVPLRPKSMGVLRELAGAGGGVLGRTELKEAVWPETRARDESLTRCISDIRIALARAGETTEFIETIPKRGYRLTVPVEAYSRTTLGRRPKSPGRAGLVIAVALLSGLLLASLVWRYSADSDTGGSPSLALLLLERADTPAGDRLVQRAIADLLYQRLSDAPPLIVRPPRSIASLDSPPLRVLADKALLISLENVVGADKRQLLVGLLDGDGPFLAPAVIGRFDVPGLDGEESIAAFVAIREQVVWRINDRLVPALVLPEHADSTQPSNVEAFRLYLEARDLLSQPGCDGTAPNILLQRSLELDPQFVPAWVALGWANYGLAATCGLGSEYYQMAIEKADEAIRRAGWWVQAVALKATVMVETGQADRARTVLEDGLQRAPDSPYLHYALSYTAVYEGDLSTAERHLYRALAIDPFFLSSEGWTPNVLIYQQKYDHFLEELPTTESTLFDFYRGFALHRLNRDALAKDNLMRSHLRHPGEVFGMLSGALLAAIDGDSERATTLLEELQYRRELAGNRDGEVTFRAAQIAATAQNTDLARQLLRVAAEQGFNCTACVHNDPALGRIAGQ